MRLLLNYPKTSLVLIALLYRTVLLVSVFPPNFWADVEGGFELGQVAANIAEGRGFSSPFEPGSTPTAWFAPLIPYLWASLFTIFGTYSPTSLVIIYALQILARAGATALYFETAREATHNRSTLYPFLISLIITLWPDHFILTTRPWYWGFQELGLSAMVYSGILLVKNTERRTAIVFGLVSGVTLLVNVTPLLLFFITLAVVLLRKEIKNCAVAALVMLAIICPWMVRNYLTFNTFVPLRSNFAAELLQGNNERGSIIQHLGSLHPNVDKEERESYRALGEIRYLETAKERALVYMKEHPDVLVRQTVMRVFFFWLTDLFHEGVYGDEPWSHQPLSQKMMAVFRVLQALLPLLMLTYVTIAGGVFKPPYWVLLVAPLVFLPLPHYLTHIHPTYQAVVRPYLLLVCLLGWRHRKQASELAQ